MTMGITSPTSTTGQILKDGTPVISFDANNNATFAGTVVSNTPLGMRNRIINGDMRIDQRNAGAEKNPAVTDTYYVDRWAVASGAASKFKIQQDAGAVTPPTGFNDYLGMTSLSAYTAGASEQFGIYQPIEGYNIADLAFGTASASSITLSFWVRSSLTGNFGGSIRNSAVNRSYPFSYTISSANTWEQKTVTITGETSGTWLVTNGVGMYVFFSLGAGATFSGTAGAWSTSNLVQPTGSTSVVGTNGATFYITGVQLEKGSTATSFDYRPYSAELAMCQRYYQVVGGANLSFYTEQYISGNSIYLTGNGYFKVNMRSAPTVTLSGAYTTVNMTGSPTYITNDNNFNAYWQGGASAGRALFHLNNGATLNFTSEL